MIIIKVTNPYYDKEYTTDCDIKQYADWFNQVYRSGNEGEFAFVDKKSNNFVSICPSNFASVEVSAIEPPEANLNPRLMVKPGGKVR